MRKPTDGDGALVEDIETLFRKLSTSANGITSSEAATRLLQSPPDRTSTVPPWRAFLEQFTNPVQILLTVSAGLSAYFGQIIDCVIIAFILLASGILSFIQEHRADNAVAELMKLVETRCTVLRDGDLTEVSLANVVPGDVAVLAAGTVVPGDGQLFEEDSLFVDQAALTGESFPVEKSIQPGENRVFAGTNVVSGTARMVVISTGRRTQLGGIATSLRIKRPEGDFQKGIRQLGSMLIQLTLFLTLFVLLVNLGSC